jgi:hypothetical protein
VVEFYGSLSINTISSIITVFLWRLSV